MKFVHYYVRLASLLRILMFVQMVCVMAHKEVEVEDRIDPVLPFYIYLILTSPIITIALTLNLIARCNDQRQYKENEEFRKIISKPYG